MLARLVKESGEDGGYAHCEMATSGDVKKVIENKMGNWYLLSTVSEKSSSIDTELSLYLSLGKVPKFRPHLLADALSMRGSKVHISLTLIMHFVNA